ncbi:MAG: response regulator transcription factor [Chloroflexota bacterium]|nr:response regulator transcription factor [Chloroflexota bacterium]MDE3194315.1 response regulator transcription factor [Chloroflexota bacterium]
MSRILVVDDEANIRHTLGYALKAEGYDVADAEDGQAALDLAARSHPDLVILDLMLPKIDGFEVARRIRRESDIPILMLTARDSELDKVVGLEIGADDYLAKPFSMRELIARVRALLRRAARREAPVTTNEGLFAAGDLVVDTLRHRVRIADRELELKPKEFDLLAFFVAHPGQAFSRSQLLESVWGFDFSGEERTVDTHVKGLRARLGDTAARPRWIETVRGVGYRFREGTPASV